MSQDVLFVLCQLAAIACAIVAGVFLTFSDFVMASLRAAHPAGGIESMQIINRKVFRTVFMVLLVGMSMASPLLIAGVLLNMTGPAGGWVILGGVVYMAGVFLVTLAFNVPMNVKLDRLDFNSAQATAYWQTFVPVWSFWNWVRALSSAAAAMLFLVASNVLAAS